METTLSDVKECADGLRSIGALGRGGTCGLACEGGRTEPRRIGDRGGQNRAERRPKGTSSGVVGNRRRQCRRSGAGPVRTRPACSNFCVRAKRTKAELAASKNDCAFSIVWSGTETANAISRNCGALRGISACLAARARTRNAAGQDSNASSPGYCPPLPSPPQPPDWPCLSIHGSPCSWPRPPVSPCRYL